MAMAPSPQNQPEAAMATAAEIDLLDIEFSNDQNSHSLQSSTPTNIGLATVAEDEQSVPPQSTIPGAMATVDLLGLEDEDYLKSTNQINAKTMALNEAYEAMEQMRQANLEIEFGRKVDPSFCVHSLRNDPKTLTKKSRITGKPIAKRTKRTCLLCSTPTCTKYSSKSFKDTHNITICIQCAPLFTLDFVVDSVTVSEDEDPDVASARQRDKINHMVDTYDRVLILLKYSAQYIEEIAATLEKSSKRNDKIGIGTNTTGIMSGIAGVAGALTILTPAGPPLLIASLLFGGSSQASLAGTKAVNYFSSANKLAARIIAYYQLARSVLCVTCVLRDAMLKDRIDLSHYLENVITQDQDTPDLTFGYGSGSYDDENDDGDEDPSNKKDDSGDDEKRSEGSSVNEEDDDDDDQTAYFVISQPNSSPGSLASPRASKPKSEDKEGPKSTEKDRPISPTPTNSSRKSPTNKVEPKPVPPSHDDSPTSKSVTTKHSTAKFFSRAGVTSSSLAGVASFTYLAGFTLSALHMALEAKHLAETVKRMQAGSPCKRAETLRLIKEDIEKLPETGIISQEWERYIQIVKEKKEKRQA